MHNPFYVENARIDMITKKGTGSYLHKTVVGVVVVVVVRVGVVVVGRGTSAG